MFKLLLGLLPPPQTIKCFLILFWRSYQRSISQKIWGSHTQISSYTENILSAFSNNFVNKPHEPLEDQWIHSILLFCVSMDNWKYSFDSSKRVICFQDLVSGRYLMWSRSLIRLDDIITNLSNWLGFSPIVGSNLLHSFAPEHTFWLLQET